MTTDPDQKKPNVVNLAEARRKQRTVRAGASNRGKESGRGPRPPASGAKRLWVYVQFLLFLAVVAYMMQLCQRGGG